MTRGGNIEHTDIDLVKATAVKFITDFPHGGRLPGMKRALDESEIRILSILHATLCLTGSSAGIDITTPDSGSIFEQQ